MTELPSPLGRLAIIEVYEEDDEPLLYSARNDRGDTFLVVLAHDSRAEQVWHFAFVSPRRLRDIRSAVVDLRDAFLLVEGGWITVLRREKKIEGRMWTEALRAAELTDAGLPEAGQVIEIEDTSPVLPDVRAISRSQRRVAATFRLIPRRRARKEVPVAPLARVLDGAQGSLDAIDEWRREIDLKRARATPGFKAKRTPRGQPPPDPLERTRMLASGTFDASFGIELHAEMAADVLLNSPVTDALQKLLELLAACGNEETLTAKLNEFRGTRTPAKLHTLLTGISNDIQELQVEWASPDGKGGRVSVTQEQAAQGVRTITKLEPQEPTLFSAIGVFDEAGHGTKSYRFIEEGEDGAIFQGRVHDDALPKIQGVTIKLIRYVVTIRETVETGAFGDPKRKRTLMDIQKVPQPTQEHLVPGDEPEEPGENEVEEELEEEP